MDIWEGSDLHAFKPPLQDFLFASRYLTPCTCCTFSIDQDPPAIALVSHLTIAGVPTKYPSKPMQCTWKSCSCKCPRLSKYYHISLRTRALLLQLQAYSLLWLLYQQWTHWFFVLDSPSKIMCTYEKSIGKCNNKHLAY